MRNRVIYQTEALYLSYNSTGSMFRDGVSKDPTGFRRNLAWGHSSGNLVEQLFRVQSANYGFSLQKTNVNQYGELGRIGSFITKPPKVDLEFSYYLADAYNETILGFAVNGENNAFHRLFSEKGADPDDSTQSKNYFILTGPPGLDLNDTNISKEAENKSVISIGNGFISSYNVSASVGSFPTATVGIVASNIKSDSGVENILHPGYSAAGGNKNCTYRYSLPDPSSDFVYASVDSTGCLHVITGQKALLPGDICINVRDGSLISQQNNAGPTNSTCVPCSGVCSTTEGSAHIQSFTINADFSREQANKIGSATPYSFFADPNTKVKLSVEAIVADVKNGDLADLICSGIKDVDIYFYPPCGSTICNDSGVAPNIIYRFKGASLISESFNSAIGSNKSVSFEFEVPVGSFEDKDVGFFISGTAYGAEFLLRQDQASAPSPNCPAYVLQELTPSLFKLENARGN